MRFKSTARRLRSGLAAKSSAETSVCFAVQSDGGKRSMPTLHRRMHVRPHASQLGPGREIRHLPVGLGEKRHIEAGVSPRANPKNGQHRVVDGDEVAEEVDQPVTSRGDGRVEVGVGDAQEQLLGAIDVHLPGLNGGGGERRFDRHGSATIPQLRCTLSAIQTAGVVHDCAEPGPNTTELPCVGPAAVVLMEPLDRGRIEAPKDQR